MRHFKSVGINRGPKREEGAYKTTFGNSRLPPRASPPSRLPPVAGRGGLVWRPGGVQRYPSDKRKKLLRSDEIVDIRENCKIPEFFEKSSLSEAGKRPDFQVTVCLHFDTTTVDFAYIKSE